MLKYKILFICLSIGLVAFAQNGTSSPYSRFGYGILGDNAIGAQRAMGGVGYALHNNRQINVMNPASYASMDSLTFLFDIGLTYQNTITREGSLKENSQSGSLDYIVMQFPLGRYMAGSVGLLPYSNVGYSFITGIDNGSDSRSCDGNISQAYVGVSGRPFKGFSIGANISYLFGNLSNTNTGIPGNGGSSVVFETMLKVRDYHLSFGAQYAIEWNKKHTITLGAVYSPGKALLGRAYRSTYDVSSNTATTADTLKMKNNYSLASTYGGGISYNYDKRLTIAADVTYQNWADAKFTNLTAGQLQSSKGQFNNRLKIALGAEFRPKNMGGNYFEHVNYRAGIFYNRSYLKINGNDMDEIGATCGFGFPLATDKSVVNVSFEYINRQCTPVKLITEDHFRISVSLTFNEMWFWQRKFE